VRRRKTNWHRSQFPDVIAVLFATAQPESAIVPAKEIAFKPIVFISLGFSAIIVESWMDKPNAWVLKLIAFQKLLNWSLKS